MTEQALPDEPDAGAPGRQAPHGAASARATGPGAPPSGKGQRRREKILAAAIRHVARNGGRGTSLAQIAAEAGVTQQGLLYYFASKDELLHAALDVRDRLEERYRLVHREYADGVRAAQASGAARADIDPYLKGIEVIAFLNGLET